MAKKQNTKDTVAPELEDPVQDASSIAESIEENEPGEKESHDDNGETENLEDKLKDLEEALLRSRAELDNALKRNVSDIEKAHKYGVERLLNELLPVVDNLEHAMNNFSDQSSQEDKEGVELTLKSFESALDKFGIRPIYPVNEQFDPIKHEAVMTSQDPEKENNEIENIFQRGWELHERVVRPARVSVIKN
jgi:molecular chaperone GrpE|tara:strand:+ start:382 stop:957 length:576 start_codon:yes stop_codon:yes gene_type:complete